MALAISGGLAGLAGAGDILGVQHRLMDGFSSGYGFDGIAVAMVALLQPLGVIPIALLFGALRTGANTMQRAAGIPSYIVDIIQGMIIYFVVAATAVLNSDDILNRFRRRARETGTGPREAREH
jgi:simple sugar transport system permease protein